LEGFVKIKDPASLKVDLAQETQPEELDLRCFYGGAS